MGVLAAVFGVALVLGSSLELETPAAYVIAREATVRVAVIGDGLTHVANLPDSEGWVLVIGKDPARTQIELAPGEGASIVPGQPPLGPLPIRRLEAAAEAWRTGRRRDLLRRALIQDGAREAAVGAWAALVQIVDEARQLQAREQALRAALWPLVAPFLGPRRR